MYGVITPFATVFHLYREFFQPVLYTIFLPSHWLLPHITIVETKDNGEREMNPVAMTIINPRKECWPSGGSNKRPPVLKSTTLLSERWGSAIRSVVRVKPNGFNGFIIFYNHDGLTWLIWRLMEINYNCPLLPQHGFYARWFTNHQNRHIQNGDRNLPPYQTNSCFNSLPSDKILDLYKFRGHSNACSNGKINLSFIGYKPL